MRIGGSLLGAMALAAGLCGCSSDDAKPQAPPPAEGSGSAVLTENAKLLDEAGTAALERVTDDDASVELSFSNTSPVLDELATGDVLIVGVSEQTPSGALWAIDDVAAEGAGLTVQAHRAALGEAFEELHIELETTLVPDEQAPLREQSSSGSERLGSLRQAVGASVPIDLHAGSGQDRFDFDGSLSLDSDVELALDIDFAEFQLDELSMTFTASETFVANLSGTGQLSFDEPASLLKVPFRAVTLFIPVPGIGALPIVIAPNVELRAGVKGGISGDVELGVTQRATFSAGLGYIDGELKAVSDNDSDFDTDDPSFGAAASIRAWAGPKLEVLLYGAVGPYAAVEGYVEASASVEGTPPCITGVVDAGLNATAGVSFIADYETTLFEAPYRLAGFDSCDPELDGPDAATTWAHTYGRDGSDGERAQAVVQLADGGYLVVGESSLFDGIVGFAASTWVMRLDALGNLLWQRAFQRTLQGLARAAAEVPGGLLVAGTTGLLKLDAGGNLLWAKQYVAEDELELKSIAPRDDGGVMLAGVLGLAKRALALQLDEQGDVVWARAFAGDDFKHVRTTSDAGSVLAGRHGEDFYLVKLQADGAVAWQRALDNRYDAVEGVEDAEPNIVSSGDDAYDAIERPDGGFVLVGESYGNFPIPEAAPGGYYANAVLELGASGQLLTSNVSRAPKDALYGAAYGVAVRPNGSSIVVARGARQANDLLSGEDVILIQDGAFSVFDGGGNDYVYSGTLAGTGRGMPLQVTRDGGAVLAVTSNSFSGRDEVWLLKLSRTASIASPFRSDLSGTSYVNTHATSFELDLPVSDVTVDVQTFTSDVASEVTTASDTRQSP
jgi:hypothetical protein